MPKDRPFFSVIIPALNEEKYLPKLLRSLERQVDRDFEVLVVDGNSTDKTAVKAGEFEGKLPKLEVVKMKQSNVSAQRNEGARRAQGKWLMFFDADSRVPVNFLSQIHAYLLETDPGCKLLTTWVGPDSDNKKDKALIMFMNLLIELATSLDRPLAGGYNLAVRRDTFRSVGGFNPKVKLGEDLDLVDRLAKTGTTMTILKNPRLVMSLRRLRRQGTLDYLRKSVLGISTFLIEGPVTREIFEYPMGGAAPVNRRRGALTKSVRDIIRRFGNLV